MVIWQQAGPGHGGGRWPAFCLYLSWASRLGVGQEHVVLDYDHSRRVLGGGGDHLGAQARVGRTATCDGAQAVEFAAATQQASQPRKYVFLCICLYIHILPTPSRRPPTEAFVLFVLLQSVTQRRLEPETAH